MVELLGGTKDFCLKPDELPESFYRQPRLKTSDLNNDVVKWLLNGEPGLSSKAMARAVTGNVSDSVWGRHPHPVDPADFRRCMLFLDAVPGARGKTELFMAMSPEWAALMGEWGNIEGLLISEIGSKWRDRDQRGSAPKTYKLMQDVLDGVG